MHASRILLRCLASVFDSMHALRRCTLLLAVEALIAGRRLTLIDLARAWPGAHRVRAPLKRLDRLLGNRHVQGMLIAVGQAMARWLLRGPRPVIVVDWSDLKHDGRWCVLRAGVPVGGRTLTLLEQIWPIRKQETAAAQQAFLKSLHRIVPAHVRPILITDAGFRSNWFRAIEAFGWHWIGRLGGNTQVRAPNGSDWLPCRLCHAQAGAAPRDLGAYEMVRQQPLRCRLVVQRRPPRGRHRLTRRGSASRDRRHLKSAQSQRQPWLLTVSTSLSNLTAQRIVALYAQRMQIELSFRDLKSHRYGAGFEDSLTRQAERLAVLLLLHTLASFAAWLAGLAATGAKVGHRLAANSQKRPTYSVLRLGREALVRGWLHGTAPPFLDLVSARLPLEGGV